MLNYSEYKEFQSLVNAGVSAVIKEYNDTDVVPEVDIVNDIAATVVTQLQWEDRVADIISIKGFLGFLLMVNRYPDLFSLDKSFWIGSFSKGSQLLDIITSGLEPELVDIVQADPDTVMGIRFLINPSSIIK